MSSYFARLGEFLPLDFVQYDIQDDQNGKDDVTAFIWKSIAFLFS